MHFLKADVGIEGSQTACEGGWGAASDNFTNLPNIPPPRPPHRQFIIYGTFGRDLGALGGDLQANYFISGAAGDQAEKSIRRCGRLKALIPLPTKLSQKGAEGEKVECD